jgi:hypothetical protein
LFLIFSITHLTKSIGAIGKYSKSDSTILIYALKFKKIILTEYGHKILGLKKQLPLSSHFVFRLDKYIRKVTHTKERRALSSDILQRVMEHIVEQYGKLEKDTAKEESFKKLIAFICEYQKFYNYISREFSISNIRYQRDSKKLTSRSWLIENLRYMFPKKYGLPISDNFLSWFVYNDTPSYGRVTKIKWTMDSKEVNKRMHIADLLAIDYRINTLTKESFSDKGIEISNKELEILKKSVSYLVYHYIFGGYHDSTYVSETTSKGLPVGKYFFIIEYEVIRAIYFAATDANGGIPVNFKDISSVAGVSDLKHHLYEGFGFGDDFDRLLSYFKQLSLDSSSKIYKDARKVLVGYLDVKRARSHELQGSLEYKSTFQGKVHHSMEEFFGVKFTSEEQVRSVVKDAYIDTINDDGVKEKIYVHGAFAFDLYLELNKDLNNFLGLDAKWKGLAIEAMGTYWHSLPAQKEADRKKRLICKERNLILLEIPEAMDRNKWCAEGLKQFKDKTGVAIPSNKLNNLYRYLAKR